MTYKDFAKSTNPNGVVDVIEGLVSRLKERHINVLNKFVYTDESTLFGLYHEQKKLNIFVKDDGLIEMTFSSPKDDIEISELYDNLYYKDYAQFEIDVVSYVLDMTNLIPQIDGVSDVLTKQLGNLRPVAESNPLKKPSEIYSEWQQRRGSTPHNAVHYHPV